MILCWLKVVFSIMVILFIIPVVGCVYVAYVWVLISFKMLLSLCLTMFQSCFLEFLLLFWPNLHFLCYL